MQKVTILLEPQLASVYTNAKAEVKEKADFLINLWLKNIFSDKNTARKRLFDTIEKASEIARKNGLTPEILQQILSEHTAGKNEKI